MIPRRGGFCKTGQTWIKQDNSFPPLPSDRSIPLKKTRRACVRTDGISLCKESKLLHSHPPPQAQPPLPRAPPSSTTANLSERLQGVLSLLPLKHLLLQPGRGKTAMRRERGSPKSPHPASRRPGTARDAQGLPPRQGTGRGGGSGRRRQPGPASPRHTHFSRSRMMSSARLSRSTSTRALSLVSWSTCRRSSRISSS